MGKLAETNQGIRSKPAKSCCTAAFYYAYYFYDKSESTYEWCHKMKFVIQSM